MRLRDESGFMLLEAMVALAIFGIIASISVPAYGSFIVRQRLIDNRHNIEHALPSVQAFYTDNHNFTGMTSEALKGYDTSVEGITVISATGTDFCIASGLDHPEQAFYRTRLTEASQIPCS